MELKGERTLESFPRPPPGKTGWQEHKFSFFFFLIFFPFLKLYDLGISLDLKKKLREYFLAFKAKSLLPGAYYCLFRTKKLKKGLLFFFFFLGIS